MQETNAAKLIAYRNELRDGGVEPVTVEAMVRDAAADMLRNHGLVVAEDPGEPAQDAEELWAQEHELYLFNQYEARPGALMWVERRFTGKVLVHCNCGYTTGWISHDQLPTADQLKADHPSGPNQAMRSALVDDQTKQAAAEWLTANGIDPSDVPLDATITVHTAPDGSRTIRYFALLRNDVGQHYLDRTGQRAVEHREAPLLVDEAERPARP